MPPFPVVLDEAPEEESDLGSRPRPGVPVRVNAQDPFRGGRRREDLSDAWCQAPMEVLQDPGGQGPAKGGDRVGGGVDPENAGGGLGMRP